MEVGPFKISLMFTHTVRMKFTHGRFEQKINTGIYGWSSMLNGGSAVIILRTS